MKKNTFLFSIYDGKKIIYDGIKTIEKEDAQKYILQDNINEKTKIKEVDVRILTKKQSDIKITIISSLDQHVRRKETVEAEACYMLSRLDFINEELTSKAKKINSAFLMLTHNIKTLSTLNIQDIECFSPMGSTQDINVRKLSDWHIFVSELDNEDKLQLAKMLLRVYKNNQHIQNDIIVYNRLLNNIEEEKEFIHHPLHKVVMRSVFSCASLLLEEGVNLNLGQTDKFIFIDYTSIQVALFYILENIVKYIKPNTTLNIKFEFNKKKKTNSVLFEMESLLVKKDEVNRIFENGFSGSEAIKSKKNGSGIGLFISKKLINENDADISLITNSEVSFASMGRHFSKNVIRIDFNK